MTNYSFTDTSRPDSNLERSNFVKKDPGPYIATVVNNEDPERLGRLDVIIGSNTGTDSGLSGAPAGYHGQVITCAYLSPFYGVKTSVPNVSRDTDANDYRASRHSYGMWMTPPDVGTRVMIIFVEGDAYQAYWIGCIPEPNLNHMVPGIASSTNTGIKALGDFDQSKESMYGTDDVPAGEINTAILAREPGIIKQPIHPFAETLRQEGLIQDKVRGTTSSSARRESPSNVFGISTPGRLDPQGKSLKLGTKDTVRNRQIDRLTGHTFVMDDGDTQGNNQLIRLRTSSGHQLLLHDTAGVVYIANGTGNAWMEFSANGAIDVYAGGGVNLRSRGDINFHSDANINMFARNEIKMSSVGRMVLDGAKIMQHADLDIQIQATGGSVTTKAPAGSIISLAGQQQIHMATGQTHLTGSQVHFNSIPTNINLVATYERTTVQDANGTGTKRVLHPDVLTTDKYRSGPLTVTQNAMATMSGMRVTTHEPYPYHYNTIVSFAGSAPSLNENIPGTPEFIAARNRISDNDTIRYGQFQADLQYNLEQQGLGQIQTAVNKQVGSIGTSSTISAIQKAADDFTKNYSLTYGLPQNVLNPITPISAGVNDIVSQTVNKMTGNAVGNLLKDQVFVNQSGVLYSVGNFNKPISGTISNVLGDLSSSTPLGQIATYGNLGLTAINIGSNILKDPKGAAVNLAASVVNDQIKNVIGGQITSVTSISTVFQNIGSSISTAVASVASSIGRLFSDVRLKEHIVKIGSHRGLNIYEYQYLWSKQRHVGVMAQDLLGSKYSDCVELDISGYYRVDYDRLLGKHYGRI